MTFGNYQIDSFWLVMILGFLIGSLFLPILLPVVIGLLIFGLEKKS